MPLKPIAQKGFLKGLNASVIYNSQPKGTIPRVSNMTLSSRGALRSCDQNLGICTLNGAGPAANEGPFTSIQVLQPTTSSRQVLALQRDFDTPLATPTGLAAALASGGTLTSGVELFYVVTALDGAGGETPASSEVHATPTGGTLSVTLTWTTVPDAYAYNVYRGTSSGGEALLLGSGLPALTNSYTDNGSAIIAGSNTYPLAASPIGATYFSIGGLVSTTFETTGTFPSVINLPFMVAGVTPSSFNGSYPRVSNQTNNTITYSHIGSLVPPSGSGGGGFVTIGTGTPISPPVANTTSTLSLIDVSNIAFTKPTNVIKSFPTGLFPPILSFPPGSAGGSYSGTLGGGVSINPSAGGILGQSCPIPDMITFAGLMILALGNGLPPYSTDGSTGGTIPLTNIFTGAFPSWVAATAYNAGDIIQPDTPNGFVYICIQAGISDATTEPTFPIGAGQTVVDHTVIWKQNGSNATPAPRGCAHAINHAGSLWLWNTAPANSTDLLDGPSVLKMSDANNPNSWNPVNIAFVSKDDGQQGMGLASFTIAESGIEPTGSLVLFKEFSTYQVIGVFGASDFAIQKAQTDLGCIAPRTIKFVPGFGIMRLTHLGVAVFDGVRDRLISEEIRPYLFGGLADISQMDFSWAYAAKADVVGLPPMYVLAIPVIGNGNDGRLTRLCCFDLVLKAWTIIDLPFGIGTIRQLLIPGGQPLTVFGGWLDAMISRWQVNDQQGWQAWIDTTFTVHSGTQLAWSFRTPSAMGEEASDRVQFRRMVTRGLWQGTTAQGAGQANSPPNSTSTASFGVTITIDRARFSANPARNIFTPTGGPADSSFELVCEIGRTGLDGYATVSGVQALGGSPVEIVETDWLAVARPVGGLARV